MDHRRFPGPGLPRDAAVDTDGKEIGAEHPYGCQFWNSTDKPDTPIGVDPNAAGSSPVFPDWWSGEPEAY